MTPDFDTTHGQLHLTGFALGDLQTNCYILRQQGQSECWIIDPGQNPEPMLEYLADQGLTPTHILLTHAHADHIAGIRRTLARYPDLPRIIHPNETNFLTDPQLNLSQFVAAPFAAPEHTGTYDEGDQLTLGELTFKVMHTPGHSPGGVTLYCEAAGAAIVGDTLFRESIGRHDFPLSDPQALVASIKEKLYALPDDTVCYPGHYGETTIGHEKANNPFVRA